MSAHTAPYQGSPLIVALPSNAPSGLVKPEFVSFYRWHLTDPLIFERER